MPSKIMIPDWINKEIWLEWEAHRKEIKKKLTPTSLKRQMLFLAKHKEDHVQILEQSIINGWTGLFPIQNKAPKQQSRRAAIENALGISNQQEAIDVEID